MLARADASEQSLHRNRFFAETRRRRPCPDLHTPLAGAAYG